MSETITVAMKDQRDISTVTTEIRTLHRQAQRMILGYAIEIGRRLREAKEMLPHGRWGEWLKQEVEFSQSTAQNFMRIFEEYGDSQTSLFGDAKSQTLGNLPYTHALKLLAVPAEEREQFAEEHRVDELSSRELEKLIRERDEAEEKAAVAEDGARNAMAELEDARAAAEDLKEKLEGAEADRDRAAEQLEALEQEWAQKADRAAEELAKLREKAAAAAEDANKTRAKLKELKANPAVPEEVLQKLGEEAAQRAKEEAEAKLAQEQAAAQQAAKEAQEQLRTARERVEALEKQLRTADPDTAAFKVRFTDIQRAFSTLREMRENIAQRDAEKAQKLGKAVLALLQQEESAWN